MGQDTRKRRFLVGGIGTVGAAVPFIASMLPSARARVGGAPVEVDIGDLAPGAVRIVGWRGKPVWILRRTEMMLVDIRHDDDLVSDPHSVVPQQPGYAQNEFRSIKPEIAVLVGVCTHLGCSPLFKPAADKVEMGERWSGGFFCPCHGSRFDLAGRVLKNSPAPTNLVVPPYQFVDNNKIVIGVGTKNA